MDKELAKQTATLLGENQHMVRLILEATEGYIESTMRSGEMENVRIPMLGIFQVNMKKLRYLTQVKTAPKTKIVKRLSINYNQPDNEETVHNE